MTAPVVLDAAYPLALRRGIKISYKKIISNHDLGPEDELWIWEVDVCPRSRLARLAPCVSIGRRSWD